MATISNEVVVSDERDDIELSRLLQPIANHWKAILLGAIVFGAIGAGASYLVEPRFTASNVFLLPQQQQNTTSNALASLGALSGLGGGVKSFPDQYVALMTSNTVSDRIIKKFDLKTLWDEKYQVNARKHLLRQVAITPGKKDGLMHVDVTDTDPTRAANMANQYVEELRALTNVLAVTEAQERRVFFENLLKQTEDKLTSAQRALEASGYTAGALKALPGTAAEGYARLRAELTSAQVTLRVLRASRADTSAEVLTQTQLVDALTAQVAKLEGQDTAAAGSGDYTNKYREYKYEETLFDLFARQYESARVDESREGALIQVLDSATPPELKSSPRRMLYGVFGFLFGLLAPSIYFVFRFWNPRGRPA